MPRSGKVMQKNLAVCGADWFALANPLNEEAIFMVVHFRVWFGDDPSKTEPIKHRVMPRPMENAFALHAIKLPQTSPICYI